LHHQEIKSLSAFVYLYRHHRGHLHEKRVPSRATAVQIFQAQLGAPAEDCHFCLVDFTHSPPLGVLLLNSVGSFFLSQLLFFTKKSNCDQSKNGNKRREVLLLLTTGSVLDHGEFFLGGDIGCFCQ
jgi:hypothetical protein